VEAKGFKTMQLAAHEHINTHVWRAADDSR
jgi:hypothetical protein